MTVLVRFERRIAISWSSRVYWSSKPTSTRYSPKRRARMRRYRGWCHSAQAI